MKQLKRFNLTKRVFFRIHNLGHIFDLLVIITNALSILALVICPYAFGTFAYNYKKCVDIPKLFVTKEMFFSQ